MFLSFGGILLHFSFVRYASRRRAFPQPTFDYLQFKRDNIGTGLITQSEATHKTAWQGVSGFLVKFICIFLASISKFSDEKYMMIECL